MLLKVMPWVLRLAAAVAEALRTFDPVLLWARIRDAPPARGIGGRGDSLTCAWREHVVNDLHGHRFRQPQGADTSTAAWPAAPGLQMQLQLTAYAVGCILEVCAFTAPQSSRTGWRS